MSFSFNRDRIAEIRGDTQDYQMNRPDRRHSTDNDEFGPRRTPLGYDHNTSTTEKAAPSSRYTTYPLLNVKQQKTKDQLCDSQSAPLNDLSTIPEFFKEIDNLKTEIAAVGASVQEIQSLHESALAAINNSQSRKFASQLGSLKTQTQQRNLDIRKRIQWIDTVNGKYPGNTSDGQIRQTQANALRKKFIGVIQEYQEMEQTFDQRYRQRIERQIRIVKPDATSDEVDDIIDSDRSNEVFTQSLMHAGRTSQAKAVLNEVQDRHQDIKRIEKTILELHQLFIDMSVLVEQQGETLKEVEQHAEDTSGNVEQGNRFISRAVKSAKATRRVSYRMGLCKLDMI